MRKPCCDGGDTNKGAWTKQEDEKLIKCINTYGEGCWRFIPKAAGLLRCGKSCRLRWINYLRPDLKRGNFGEDEEDLIIKLHALLGNRWSLIAGRLPGRTDNEVKNYWNTHLRRKLLGMGLDPNNQKLRGGQHRVCENITSFSPCCSFFPPSSARAVLSAGGPFGGHARHQNHIGCNVDNDVDGVSDTASSMEDDKHALPDLNLDLTISTPSPRETRKLYEPFGVAQERE